MHSRKIPKGITLIELMITLGIIAVVASIAVPAYQGYIKTSYVAECQNEVAAIKLALEEYFLENGSYFSGSGTTALEGASASIYDASKAGGASGHCDYQVNSTTTNYTITATAKSGGKLDGEGTVYTYTKE